MNADLHTLTFAIDPQAAFDTLEAVLATARRGGLDLSSLYIEAATAEMTVRTTEPDRFALFRARVDNLAGILHSEEKVARMHVA